MSKNIEECDEIMEKISKQFQTKVLDDVERYQIYYLIEIVKKIVYKNVKKEYIQREGAFLLRFKTSIFQSIIRLDYDFVYFAVGWLFVNVPNIQISMFFEFSGDSDYFLYRLRRNFNINLSTPTVYSSDFPACRYKNMIHPTIGSRINFFRKHCICTIPERQDLVYIKSVKCVIDSMELQMLQHYSTNSEHVLLRKFGSFYQFQIKNININEI